MSLRLITLEGASVRADGTIVDNSGQSTGLRINPGGHTIYDPAGQIVGTLTKRGIVYDREGQPVASVQRLDLEPAHDDRECGET